MKRLKSTFHLKSLIIFSIVLMAVLDLHCQEKWISPDGDYLIEIPQGFGQFPVIGTNVDFKAGNDNSSIVVVIKSLPKEYENYTIWDILGDLSTYGAEWEAGAQEYFENPHFIKYGKTEIDGQDTFWYDYTANNPKDYFKVYQTQKEGKIYTITLTCRYSDYATFSAIWYRFKHNIKFL